MIKQPLTKLSAERSRVLQEPGLKCTVLKCAAPLSTAPVYSTYNFLSISSTTTLARPY